MQRGYRPAPAGRKLGANLNELETPMKILLAVDGSAYTKKMLAYLTTHEEMFGSNNDLTLFTVQLPLPPRHPMRAQCA